MSITTPLLFFTRWITHFCAPTFVFLSGISAYLAGTRRSEERLSVFLIKRGCWLIAVELIFISLAIFLNPLYNTLILQVIWAIGGSMILLGLLVKMKTPLVVVGIIGAVIFFGHNILDIVSLDALNETSIWKLLVSGAGDIVPIGHHRYLFISYALLPWTGVMLIGYVFGSLYLKTANSVKRRRKLLYTGLGLLMLFLFLREFNIYGDPSPWSGQKTAALSVISFLNVTKYPCSLLYLSMTIGVSLVLLSLLENRKNRIASILITYGNVPFFYYLCHWFLLQFIHVVVFFALGYQTSQIVTPNSPFLFLPPGFGFSLTGVYLIWLLVIVLLYFPCKWYSRYKKTNEHWWLSYL